MCKARNIKKTLYFGAFLAFFFGLTNIGFAADRFWVGPLNGVINSVTNWSLISGGAGGASVPGLYDSVIFNSGANNATVNVDTAVNDFIIDSNYSGLVSIADGVILTVGSADGLSPLVTVGKSGRQIPTTTATSTDQDLGGAFTLSVVGAEVNVTAIKLKQIGSLATSSISNIRLSYKHEDICSAVKPAGTTDFGVAASFDGNGIATTTANTPLTLSPDIPVCLYIVYDLEADQGISVMGQTIDFEITNPSTDIVINTGAIGTTNKVNITGSTMIVVEDSVVQTIPTTSNPACSDSKIYSLISIHVEDEAKNPTIFYLQNCQVWKKEGDSSTRHLTNKNLQVHSLIFTDMTPNNMRADYGIRIVRMEITMSNMDPGDGGVFLNITRTLKTSAGLMSWPGNL